MKSISPTSSLVWYLAELEAFTAGFNEVTPWHFLLGCFKLCDFDLDAFLDNAPKNINADRDCIIREVKMLRKNVDASFDPKLMRRQIRRALGKGNASNQERPLGRSPEARAIFKFAGKLAESAKDRILPVVKGG